MVVDLPFTEEQVKTNLYHRTFSPNTDPMEFVWHRDREDRVVDVIEPGGWKFQFEDQLPIELKKFTRLEIPAGSYHRVIPGTEELKIFLRKL
jgi:hypothetical protein